ncbi:hypothetical protein PCASD_05691 [Puccinia coronata f. sp. avenae]|uniref:Uncharacterized protein n=1 Tax=Puccinia coronata f. sp. avenae TaxID=200324 RepID=A0A2N5UVI5_9BASI|nr:hypothetical protein PCASD_05691 [Puccinia coronata f. sp. avenae]
MRPDVAAGRSDTTMPGRPGDGGKGDGCGDFPSNGSGRCVAANRPHRPCSVAPTIMVTVLPTCLGRQGRHVVTSRPHAVSMTEPSQVRRLSSEFVPLYGKLDQLIEEFKECHLPIENEDLGLYAESSILTEMESFKRMKDQLPR